jgi:hypothetical protein
MLNFLGRSCRINFHTADRINIDCGFRDYFLLRLATAAGLLLHLPHWKVNKSALLVLVHCIAPENHRSLCKPCSRWKVNRQIEGALEH